MNVFDYPTCVMSQALLSSQNLRTFAENAPPALEEKPQEGSSCCLKANHGLEQSKSTELVLLELSLKQWIDHPRAFGNKVEAARRIRAAYLEKSTELSLRELGLNTLPDGIQYLTHLEGLDLFHNKFISFPKEIGKLVRLQELNCSHNQLTMWPKEIENLDQLVYLNISSNCLYSLPKEIGKFALLRELNLSCNNLKELCLKRETLPALVFLNLARNQLTNASSTIRGLPRLQELNLCYNQFTSLQGLEELPQLQVLRFAHNQLVSVEGIEQFLLLEVLNLSYNRLTQFPGAIGDLLKLRILNLGYNRRLAGLPSRLSEIASLVDFISEGTRLTEEQVMGVLTSCQRLRAVNPDAALGKKLDFWARRAQTSPSSMRFVLEFTQEEKITINEWLVRLDRAKDFRDCGEDLAQIVCSILRFLKEPAEFKAFALAQMSANNACCEDRAAMAFNELYVAWRLMCLKEKSLGILEGLAKTLALRKEVGARLGENEEGVEAFLYYEMSLAKRLGLVTAVKRMAYEDIGRRAEINPEDLVKAVEKTYLHHLAQLPILDQILDEEVKAKISSINEEYCKQLERGGDFKRIQKAQEEAVSQAKIEWFQKQKKTA